MTAPGQADEYTPAAAEVRHRWVTMPHEPTYEGQKRKRAEFDRFLAARDRAVREAALLEAAQIAEACRGYGVGYLATMKREIISAIRAAADQTGTDK